MADREVVREDRCRICHDVGPSTIANRTLPMTDRSLLDTSTATWSELFGNGKRYVVPRYQRDYAWGIDEWSDLWFDVEQLHDSSSHYMGTVVLKAEVDSRWTIIDGQQRLATLSILALAVIAEIQGLADEGVAPDENRERARLLRDQLISSKDAASLKEESRLRLNQSDDGFFQTRLVQDKAPPHPNKLKGSEKNLWGAYQYFKRQVRDRFQNQRDGAALATFLHTRVASSLVFIQIKVQDELSAYTVFETLNARGLELTTTDLLKNYLFSLAAQSTVDLETVQLQWQKLVSIVEVAKFPDFLYHYVVSLGKEAKKHRLFGRLRELIKTREDVFAWLERLEQAAELYVALSDPNDELWFEYPGAKVHVRELVLFGVDQYKPLVLAAKRVEKREIDLTKLLGLCSIVSMRATIIGHRNTADVLRAYQSAVKAIVEKGAASVKAIFSALSALYPSDEEFRSRFEVVEFDTGGPRKRLVKYILCSLEPHFGGPEIDPESSPFTIEHILPEHPGETWAASFPSDDQQRFVFRLGNLTLLEAPLNRLLGASDYASKVARYPESASRMTQSIDASDWTPQAVIARQKGLAEGAVQRWRLDY